MEGARLVVISVEIYTFQSTRCKVDVDLDSNNAAGNSFLPFHLFFGCPRMFSLSRRHLWPNWRKLRLIFFVFLMSDKETKIVFIRVLIRRKPPMSTLSLGWTRSYENLHKFSGASR